MKENGLSTLCPTPITNLGAPLLFPPRGCSVTRSNAEEPPATLALSSLARSLNPSFFPFPTLSLSLPSPFAHCHSANDDGRRGVGGGRGGGGGRTSQRPFRAWHIQCVRAACVGSLPSHARGAPFGSERSCVRFCFHVDRISSEQS